LRKVRIGVLGGYRGTSMINYCEVASNAEIVAICDKNLDVLEEQKKNLAGQSITFYDNFDEFLQHDMDAVVLANYANEHAPFAIKCLNAGKHVFSEVLPVQTLKEAVELIETVERTGLVYAYGENYCYMEAPYEMRKLYRQGKIGEFEYAEGEYIHNTESIWPSITYGEKDHWRNRMYATFYCTHSLGPIIHITGLRPVSVVGFEGQKVERERRVGSRSGQFGIEMVTLENDALVRSMHGCLYKNSVWYCMYGSKGRMESAREDANGGGISKLYVNWDEYSGDYGHDHLEAYEPKLSFNTEAEAFGHGGSDFYTMWNFVEKILGNPDADTIDIYEALDMCLPGIFAYRSILKGGARMTVPNLRDRKEREKWRNDVACTDPKAAGDQLLPTFSRGTPEIDDGVYEHVRELWEAECRKKEGTYREQAFHQGGKKL